LSSFPQSNQRLKLVRLLVEKFAAIKLVRLLVEQVAPDSASLLVEQFAFDSAFTEGELLLSISERSSGDSTLYFIL
jgi:hypothetical protein